MYEGSHHRAPTDLDPVTSHFFSASREKKHKAVSPSPSGLLCRVQVHSWAQPFSHVHLYSSANSLFVHSPFHSFSSSCYSVRLGIRMSNWPTENPIELRLKFPFREPGNFFSPHLQERRERSQWRKPVQLAMEELVCWKIYFLPHLSLLKLSKRPSQDMKTEKLGLY